MAPCIVEDLVDDVFEELNLQNLVPDTGLLDCSAHIAKAQLAQKSKRHPPSRDKLRESFRRQVRYRQSAKKSRKSMASRYIIGVTTEIVCIYVCIFLSFPIFCTFPCRSSCGDLAEPIGISPTASVSSMPSCLPFPWFGDKSSENEEDQEKNNERLRSLSSSSLLPVTEWSSQQVCRWLVGMSMEQYAAEFSAKGVNGEQLLNMDTDKLKALGVCNHNDRSCLKKKLKDMRKREEKEQRERDKSLREVRDTDATEDKKSHREYKRGTIRTESLL
uniref:SAM domain-containing protein n=1 Tax=Periophthalmus magnuspinnatus TaxID=409849 RepID=A0A3B3ZH00_9GOBI